MLRLLALLSIVAASGASAQSYEGRLEAGDGALNSGEFRDEYTVPVQAGQEVSAVVTSAEFDTYVILVADDGVQAEDDDCTAGETSRSCAALVAPADGEVRVLVTSYAVGETGAYRVEIAVKGPMADDDEGTP